MHLLGRSGRIYRCDKRLQCLLKIIRKGVYYFVKDYYLNNHHMKKTSGKKLCRIAGVKYTKHNYDEKPI